MLCASAPLPEPGPISCGQVLIVNFVLFESLLAELFRRHGKPPVARRTARGGARSVCQFPDSAGGGAFGTRRRWGRRRSGLVCLSFRCVCSDFASKAARRDVEERAAPATADPVEGAKQDVPPSVLLLRCFARFPSPAAGSCRSPTTARRCHQRAENSTRYTTVRTRYTTVRANTVGRGRASQRQRGSGEVGKKGRKGRRKGREGRREGRDGRKEGRQGQGRARQGQARGRQGHPGRTKAGRGFRVCSCCSAPAWSSCVFVRSNRCCFLGSCSPLSKESARR